MSYLRSTRGRVTLACGLVTSVWLGLFPGVDLTISRVFYRDGFGLATQWWSPPMQALVPVFLVVSMAAVVGVYLYNRRSRRTVGGIDGRKVLYLLVVLLAGPGLIVNVGLKDHFGRPRPRDVAEFGGASQFTPAFRIGHQCDRNCSFASGDAAAAFFALTLARALSRRRVVMAAAVGFGAVISLSRIAVGAHFFSDTVVSFGVMWILTDVLYHYLFSAQAAPLSRIARTAALGQALPAARRIPRPRA